ncbi:hypothetical protein CORC01_03339 [Colletotrichum orchidophilum]|uniref:Uncharacterized protein n=1 Tax=Colletotrichum orchidophilum TaxID=1209926 RepID=A0A1G4BJ22_9PEZI|nr:uncharacterized protein CORC01_03339 [Colletotrichum orchidophilum]OHF01306.1 hypothetical protein CORC01_03339 [Colletotrichum orchidophilum]
MRGSKVKAAAAAVTYADRPVLGGTGISDSCSIMIDPRIENQFRVSPQAPHLQLAISRRLIAPTLGSQKKQEAREIPRDRHTQGDPAPRLNQERAPKTVDSPNATGGWTVDVVFAWGGLYRRGPPSDEIRPSPSEGTNQKKFPARPATSSSPFGALTRLSSLSLASRSPHLHLFLPGLLPKTAITSFSESPFIPSAVSVNSSSSPLQ